MSLAHVNIRHGIQMMRRNHPTIRALSKSHPAPALHGSQIWRSSFLLMDYLATHRLVAGQRVMEIGCGWGLLGIYCARHFTVDVLLTDADPRVFPYAEEHARLNGVQVRTEKVHFDGISERLLREQNVILGADICFWPELGTQLRRLTERALHVGVTRILLADPGRPGFLRLATACERELGAELISWPATHGTKGGYLLVVDRSADV